MKTDTIRKCIVTGETLDKSTMLRFVAAEGVGIVPDFKKKLGGKGIYVSNAKSKLKKAVESNLFAKGLKKRVKVDENLSEVVESILRSQALHAISLARKAGCLVWGLDKVLDLIKKGKVVFLLEATDAGDDGAKKIASHAKDLEIYSLFNSGELDKELNRENTVHLAFISGNATNLVRETFVRLASFLNN